MNELIEELTRRTLLKASHTSGASMDGWMDGFIDADPSLWAICSLALWIKYMLSSTRLYHFLDELGASPGPVVATWTGGPCIS